MKTINEPEKSLTCPKCGGFIQYFKNVEVCRDCEFIIKTHPIDMSGELPEYVVVHVVDGRTKTKRIITADNEKEALDAMGEIILSHHHGRITCSADAISSWDVGMYRKVS